MGLTGLSVDESEHNKDGLLLCARDGDQQVTAFIRRGVMDNWAFPGQPYEQRKSLLRQQYNALGKHNLPAIERIVRLKYQRGPAGNRQHPFVDVLLADIIESGEILVAADQSAPVSLERPRLRKTHVHNEKNQPSVPASAPQPAPMMDNKK